MARRSSQTAPSRPRLLRSTHPAMDFAEGFPIGNGKIGLMCYGGPARLVFVVNHRELYDRAPPNPQQRPGFWHEVRATSLAGDWSQTGKMLASAFATWRTPHGY